MEMLFTAMAGMGLQQITDIAMQCWMLKQLPGQLCTLPATPTARHSHGATAYVTVLLATWHTHWVSVVGVDCGIKP